jgi:hopanoid biosynthesis associated protein HpnK
VKKIIITGDDFGLALPVNEAIIQAHREGILTTASLMVGESYFEDAVQQAKQNPSLKVGLHLTLVEGRPVAPLHQIPDLLNSDGVFSTQLVRAGFRFFFLPGVRKQLENEIRAQFEAFRRTGLPLDHANAHNHMHLHPTVLGLMLKVGKDYGLNAVRLPNEPPLRSWKAGRKAFWPRHASWLFLFPWMQFMRYRLRREGIRYNDFLFGMTDSGAMTQDLVLRIFANLPEGVTEICFHPATGRCTEIDLPMPCYKHEDEFMALSGKLLLKAAQEGDFKRITFSDLKCDGSKKC